jgi:hypothetical protein
LAVSENILSIFKTVHYSIDSKHYENISQLESQLRLVQDNLDKQVDNCAQPHIDLYRTMSDNAQQNGKIYLSDGLWLDKDGNMLTIHPVRCSIPA